VIDRYIAHRAERERGIIDALGDGGAGLEEIVARAYADTPVALHPVATHSALAHLQMLEADGRVKRANDRWIRTIVE
jgi:ribonuclease/clavin/mitogillin